MPHSELECAQQNILLVDDDATNVSLMERVLAWAGYQKVSVARNGLSALSDYQAFRPDLIILDLNMPQLDGFGVLKEIREQESDQDFLPILVYTADVTRDARERALSLGASDFLTKPGEKTEIKLRIKNLLVMRVMHKKLAERNDDLESLVVDRTRELEAAHVEILNRLATAGEYRDEDTGDHTIRVGEMAGLIAASLGLERGQVETIKLAARLHDLGKIGISDQILMKPAKLTQDEFAEMKRHTELGAGILSNSDSPLLQMAERIALTHHEWYDGTGYPRGIAGDVIPIEGRIVAVADVFDALTNERPYKKAWSTERAVSEIRALSGSQFDPCVVDAFLGIMGESGLNAA